MNKMATFRRETSPAGPILFLYFSFHVILAVSASDLLVHHWNDPSKVANIKAGTLSFTNIPTSVSLRSSAGNIRLQDIPQVLSLALGFSSLQSIDWNGLSVGDIFNRPKANVLFIIDGIEKGKAVSVPGKSLSYTIIKNDANSNLDIFRISPIRNFVSHISGVLKEKPLVVSFSAQKQLANAASTTGQNAHTVTWDDERKAFEDEASSNEMKLSKDELLKNFETSNFGEGIKYLTNEHKFVVSVPGKEDVSFDMNEKDDFMFFAEIQGLFHLFDEIKKFDSLTQDRFVDFYTFGISTVKRFSQRYGGASAQLNAALHILNNVIPKITKLFSELYGGQVLVEVVNLKEETDRRKVLSSNENDINEDEESHLRFRRDVSPEKSEKEDCKTNENNFAFVDNKYDDEFPPIFNIILWLMIILVLTVYAVSIVMWYMDPGRDSVIYRVTSQHMKTE
ncbi:renin receptor-like [Dendronephthya gigantea]|uniref:renin receptor-like n=1 Tax=Dendronephthya gigantea TaxID=151771 RepID=UPI00106A27A7|nr:renin receptor-like [Dendronephthya gigantea]